MDSVGFKYVYNYNYFKYELYRLHWAACGSYSIATIVVYLGLKNIYNYKNFEYELYGLYWAYGAQIEVKLMDIMCG